MMGSIIMKLVQIITRNLRTYLTTTLWYKRLKATDHNLPKKIIKGRIERVEFIKLLGVQAIPYSIPQQ